jgi:hypothetical protein
MLTSPVLQPSTKIRAVGLLHSPNPFFLWKKSPTLIRLNAGTIKSFEELVSKVEEKVQYIS